MSLLSKVAKVAKKAAGIVTAINPSLGGGLTRTNAMMGSALLTAGTGGVGALSIPGGNPLAALGGFLGSKVGLPASIGTALTSAALAPKAPSAASLLPSLPSVDDVRSYAAWKIAPDSLLRGLRFDAMGNPIKKRRRINPLNARAAKRAIRRIKMVRKITAGIERALPKVKPRSWGHAHFHRHRR